MLPELQTQSHPKKEKSFEKKIEIFRFYALGTLIDCPPKPDAAQIVFSTLLKKVPRVSLVCLNRLATLKETEGCVPKVDKQLEE